MLISNPLASPYFLQTLYVVGGLLGGIFVILLIMTRFNIVKLSQSVLFQRWKTWAVIAPIFSLAVMTGYLTTMLLVALLVFQGVREYSRLVGLPDSYRRILLALALLAPPVAMASLDAFLFLPPILLIVATLQPLIVRREADSVRHLAFAALGWGYVAWLLTHIVLLQKYSDGGTGILLTIGLAVALSDVGAFVVGKLFGKHPLAPTISPNKTREGLIGNFIGAYIGVGLMAFALPDRFLLGMVILLPIIIALGSVWGDLLESVIKREAGVKDAGGWLSGFGGLLDRIDSLIIVVPLVFYFVRVVA